MGQKGTRDEGVDEPVVQSTIIYVAAYLDGFFFLKVRYFGALASKINPKYLGSLSVKSHVELKNWGMMILPKATWNGEELVVDEDLGSGFID